MIDQRLIDVSQIAIQAGKEILKYYGLKYFEIKEDQTPITQADRVSHDCIVNGLRQISSYAILSEEDPLSYAMRKDPCYWLIDPLDGTKSFIEQREDFTVNIALITAHQPVLGVVYVPVLDELYMALKDQGAYRITQARSHPNQEKLNGSRRIMQEQLIGYDSVHHTCEKTQAFFEYYQLDKKICASSLKLCHMALGICDIYPRFNATKEWDTAAAHIILRESGGEIIDCMSQQALRYSKPDVINAHFVAFSNTQMYHKIYQDITTTLQWR